jgi:hypothetical protein
MSTDPRLTVLKLASNWNRKVELGELELHNAFDLLIERIAAIVPKFAICETCGLSPCPDRKFCESMRTADQKIAASRKCAQCGGGGATDPHRDNEKKKIVYLHPACRKFWEAHHR